MPCDINDLVCSRCGYVRAKFQTIFIFQIRIIKTISIKGISIFAEWIFYLYFGFLGFLESQFQNSSQAL